MIAQASTIEQAAPGDMAAIEQLLQSHQLPASDLAENPRIQLFVCRHQGDLAGVVGTEIYGKTALLRSLAVQSTYQGRGFGTGLVRHVEKYVRTKNISSLYLLTTTATKFFSSHGYRRIPQDQVPETIRETTEFSTLCPASAVCMRKEMMTARQRG